MEAGSYLDVLPGNHWQLAVTALVRRCYSRGSALRLWASFSPHIIIKAAQLCLAGQHRAAAESYTRQKLLFVSTT
jgi:hypothetical protein